MFLDHSKSPVKGFPFSGWYFMYPGEEQHMGLVSMTSNDPPAMGWIFVDADTRAVRFGGRKDTVDHVVGPWHWTPNEKYVSLRGSGDGFAAVRADDEGSRWAVYWDPDGSLAQQTPVDRYVPIGLKRQLALGINSQDTKYASEEEGSEEAPRQRRSRKDKTKSKRKSKRSESEQGGGGPLGGLGGLGGLDGAGDTVSGLANGATGALGGIAGGALGGGGGGGGDKSDTLRLRLDLNLDIEITLKARIHGDLELALL
ncbi:hypothetical protein BN1708_007406 [Verticillium longisporum]|uniref:Uncharacterized protein n=1 Tax=Verticillium longisporum TaxID=100787 RepID=A0A0G4MTJ2_VERLO|nr:hypothetical protein BN1708_007406 [Verticillium longisporum]